MSRLFTGKMMIEASGCQGAVDEDFKGKGNQHLVDTLLFDDIVPGT